MKKIKVGAVSYLNALPLLQGIEQDSDLQKHMTLSLAYPAKLVAQMMNQELDIALMPAAALLLDKQLTIISKYGIAAHQHVASVCIFSEVPMEEITTVYLDTQSRTSILLAQILLKEFWKKEVSFISGEENFMDKIKGNTAAVIIGDRALQSIPRYAHVYDLASAWHQHTGWPFIFAAWIAQGPLPADFVRRFDTAQAHGLTQITQLTNKLNIDYYDMELYYQKDIVYTLDEGALQGLQLFLEKVKQHDLL